MKRRREEAGFWRDFEAAFGPPGERPDSYWSSLLGHVCHVSIGDVERMTPRQLYSCWELVEKAGSGAAG